MTLFNYAVGTVLIKKPNLERKFVLFFGISANVLLLGYFKYADFFISNINAATGLQISLLHIVLPLGISFFTFTQIAYLVDTYRGRAREYDFLNYALFVTFFPHLLAGPILHHGEMMPQFDRIRNKVFSGGNMTFGIYLFFIGLFKKVVIADMFSPWANLGFDFARDLSLIEAWATSLSYTLQLYFDFSAYTDMALGVGMMFNIKLPINFNSPYKACDIQDFWRRWHITLSRFLRDYVYIPLGGNRMSEHRVLSNLMFTFLIGGLWHGAGWTFVCWGFLHGIAIVAHRVWKRLNCTMPKALAWFLTFNFINITWVFFRAKSWDDSLKVLKGMFGFGSIILPQQLASTLWFLKKYGIEFGSYVGDFQTDKKVLFAIFGFLLIVFFSKNSNEMMKSFKPSVKHVFILAFLMFYGLMSLFMADQLTEFLYFNF